MSGGIMGMEIISLIECSWYIFLNFRTVSMTKKGISFELKVIFNNYRENGFFLDIFGVLPFNLIFGVLETTYPLYIITTLRLTRCLLLITTPKLLSQVEMTFRSLEFTIKMSKAFVSFLILWNSVACAWYYTNTFIEDESAFTWIRYQQLVNEKLYLCYLMALYYVLNIVTSVGYGDMFPMTNTERLFTCFMINTGDALFAVIFGIVAALAITSNSFLEEFFKKMR